MQALQENRLPKTSLEEILEDQRRQPILVTVQEVEDDRDHVKLTPWTAGGGCQCSLAVEVPKEAIASVDPTGEMHLCCGKSFHVVDLEFTEGATIGLQDLFSQLMTHVQSSHPEEHSHNQPLATPPAYGVGPFVQPAFPTPQMAAPPAMTPCGPPPWQQAGGDPRTFLPQNGRYQ